MTLGITALIVSISVKIIALLQQYMVLKILQRSSFPDSFFTKISNNLLHFLIMFCQRSFRHVPKSNALKWIYIGTSVPIMILGKGSNQPLRQYSETHLEFSVQMHNYLYLHLQVSFSELVYSDNCCNPIRTFLLIWFRIFLPPSKCRFYNRV